jgi:hypothetical protein
VPHIEASKPSLGVPIFPSDFLTVPIIFFKTPVLTLVRTAGLEPAQGFPQGILSPLRLPFRHVREAGLKTQVRAAPF